MSVGITVTLTILFTLHFTIHLVIFYGFTSLFTNASYVNYVLKHPNVHKDDEQVDDTGVVGNVKDVKDVDCGYYAGDYSNDGVKWSN